ncbi:MAG: hypothetical protein L3J18_00260 [Candidatus Brocadia sp.]|nr:MAG: hypothetical protein L3J18_00260 [Candidatus Brocadia sp.]
MVPAPFIAAFLRPRDGNVYFLGLKGSTGAFAPSDAGIPCKVLLRPGMGLLPASFSLPAFRIHHLNDSSSPPFFRFGYWTGVSGISVEPGLPGFSSWISQSLP